LSIKKLYAKQFDGAETEWVETIMTPAADKHFCFNPDWFENQPSSKPNRKKKNVFHISEDSWFVNPEEEMSRVIFPLEEELTDNKTKIHYLNSAELSNYIGTNDNTAIENRKTKISQWFYQRYDFVDTIRMHVFRGMNNVIIGLLLLFVACSFCPYFWEKPKCIALFFIISSGAFLSAAIYLKFYKNNPIERIDDISSSLPTILTLKNTSLKLAIRLIDKTLILSSFRIFYKCLLILISGHDRSPRIKSSFVFFIGIPWHLEPLRMKFLFLIYWISIRVIIEL
jgi:hypothetical protein